MEFQNAISFDPSYPEAHLGLADAFDRQGKTSDAAAERQKAASLRPGSIAPKASCNGRDNPPQARIQWLSEELIVVSSEMAGQLRNEVSGLMSILTRRCLLSSAMVLIAAVCCVGTIRGREDPRDGRHDRKLYADKVRQTYNFAFGEDDISSPGNAAVEGKDFSAGKRLSRRQTTAGTATRRPTTSGARRCTPTPSARRSTAPASISSSAPRASNSPATATVATTRLAFWPARSTPTQPWTAPSTATV